MKTTELKEFCESLNAEAVALRDSTEDRDDIKALHVVARRHHLEAISDLEDSTACVIYEAPDGTRLNLWIDAPGGGICDGGLGFDDQTEWYED